MFVDDKILLSIEKIIVQVQNFVLNNSEKVEVTSNPEKLAIHSTENNTIYCSDPFLWREDLHT